MPILSYFHYFLFFTFIPNFSTSNNPQVYEGVISRASRIQLFMVQIGTPPQNIIDAGIDFNSVDFVVNDVLCGKRRRNGCPKYCNGTNEASFPGIYCKDMDCFEVTPRYYPTYCWVSGAQSVFYYSNASKTIKRSGEKWKGKGRFGYQLYGEYVYDQIQFYDAFKKYTFLNFTKAKFVAGYLMDKRFYNDYGAIIGLTPGNSTHQNLIEQMYSQKLIKSPMVSFNLHNYFLGGNTKKTQYKATIGDIKSSVECPHWNFHRSLKNDKWLFEVESFEILNIGYKKRNVVLRFDPSNPFTTVPFHLLEKLYNKKQLFLYGGDQNKPLSPRFHFLFNQSNPIIYKFKFKDGTIYTHNENDGSCSDDGNGMFETCLYSQEKQLYNDDVEITIGAVFLRSYCFGFNYENKTFAMSKLVLNSD